MNATLEVICYRSKTLKNGNHPLMLRITKDNKIKYLSLGVSMNPKNWDFKKHQTKPSCPNKEYIDKLILAKKTIYQDKIIELTSLEKDYTPQSLSGIIEKTVKQKTLEDLYREQIKNLNQSNRIGNAKVYSYSLRSLLKYTKGKLSIPVSDITPEWLKKYEAWLKQRKNGENTLSQLFRTLRSIYNQAIEQGIVKKETYPFDKYKISKFNTSTKKRSITKEDIQKIQNLDLSNKDFYTQLSRDIFLFSYLGAGINFTDLAFLKPTNIVDGRVSYIRKKTGKKVSFKLSDNSKEIVIRYADLSLKCGYIFPILNTSEHNTPLKQSNRIHKMIGHVNKKLKIIGQSVGIQNLTTYVARHT